jgi:hypothetical protein
MLKVCNYGDCMKEIGENGVIVSLHRATSNGEKRAGFCCVAHAAASLLVLAADLKQDIPPAPIWWRHT